MGMTWLKYFLILLTKANRKGYKLEYSSKSSIGTTANIDLLTQSKAAIATNFMF